MFLIRGIRSALWLIVVAGLSAFFTFVLFTSSPAPWVRIKPTDVVTSESWSQVGQEKLKNPADMQSVLQVDENRPKDSENTPNGSLEEQNVSKAKIISQVPYIRIGEQFGTAELNEKDAAFLKSIRDGSLKVAQDDPRLIEMIQKYFLFGPSDEKYAMKVLDEEEDTSMGQAAAINDIFNSKIGGFFVECGALDGETRSNTYFFERFLNWEGILIEADPRNFELLLKKNRKSYSLNACLSTSPHPVEVIFKQQFNVGQITSYKKVDPKQKGLIRVLCFPFYSVMLALKRTTVDYFSLDVEGAEVEVLNTIPFEKVNIRTLSVEFFHVKGGSNAVKTFMEKNGYEVHSKVTHKLGLANDFIFKKGHF